MRDTCEEFSRSGWFITTRAARTRAWGQGFLNPQEADRGRPFQAVGIPILGGLHHEYGLEKLAA
jgi:hypothetical protein